MGRAHFPCTRFVSSAAMRGSISTAVTCFAFSNIRTVKFPVPGPTSRTLSVGRRFACTLPSQPPKASPTHVFTHCVHNPTINMSKATDRLARQTHDWAVCGFFRICWPNRSVLKMGLCAPEEELEEAAALDFAFADGWCARLKRSEVARGIADEMRNERVSCN